jgi:hypothetical protein
VTVVFTNIGAIDDFDVANPMGDATGAILGMTTSSVDPAPSVVWGFVIAIPMGNTIEA